MSRFIVVALALSALAVPAVVGAAGPAPGLLAYEAPDGIHVVRADGSGDHRLAGSVRGDQNPKWSPDGRRIVVAHALQGMSGDLFVLGVAAGTRTPVADASGATPDWTPDGSAVVFESDDRLYSVRPDGGEITDVTDEDAYEPAFAPDGTLAFAGYDHHDRPALLTTAEGSAPSLVATRGDAWSPAWWPDGSALAFDSDGDYPGGSYRDWAAEIHTIARDGSGERRLTRNRVWDGDAAVSPDGTRIAFDTGRYGWLEIALMDADGTHQHRLTHELRGDACCASWQPGS